MYWRREASRSRSRRQNSVLEAGSRTQTKLEDYIFENIDCKLSLNNPLYLDHGVLRFIVFRSILFASSVVRAYMHTEFTKKCLSAKLLSHIRTLLESLLYELYIVSINALLQAK